MAKERNKKVGFEEELKELESIVERLDGGSLSLEESLKLFEKGIRLSRRLQSSLENTSMKVSRLLEEGGNPVEVPLSGKPSHGKGESS